VEQADMRQNPGERAVEILDPTCQRQRQDRARQRLFPMLHRLQLLGDRPSEIGEIMRVAMLAVKAEGEDRQSDVARIADAMNDPGLGKQKRDQPDITVVAGHLVDDAAIVRRQSVKLLQIGVCGRIRRDGIGHERASRAPIGSKKERLYRVSRVSGTSHLSIGGVQG
jgi:hypothetical protein